MNIKQIKKELKKDPSNHWLLTQLSSAYYEKYDYDNALKYILFSLHESPQCPLSLWHYASCLDMLEDYDAAIKIYNNLIKSKKTYKNDACWESKEWEDSLKIDCHYRIGLCYAKLELKDKALKHLKYYIDNLKNKDTIYSLNEAKERMKTVQETF